MKKITAVFMAGVCALSMAFTAYAGGQNVKMTNVCGLFTMIGKGDNHAGQGPVTITKGKVTENGVTKDVYLIAVYGLNNSAGDSNNMTSAMRAGLGLNNPYLSGLKDTVLKNVPKNANLLVTGSSLGGIVVQQLVSDKSIKANYNILHTVVFGAPYIDGTKEGTVRRLADVADIIPNIVLSLNFREVKNVAKEDGGYGSDYTKAHGWSYSREDVWGEYDVTGVKGGSAVLDLEYDSMTYYKF